MDDDGGEVAEEAINEAGALRQGSSARRRSPYRNALSREVVVVLEDGAGMKDDDVTVEAALIQAGEQLNQLALGAAGT
jgi:hypothetical protein